MQKLFGNNFCIIYYGGSQVNSKKNKKTKNMLTFVGCFDMIYLAAENGGKLFQKSSS